MNKNLSVIIPVYFNANSIPILFERIKKVEIQLRSIDIGLELIFVDDGSGDTSLEELFRIKNARPKTKVIKLTRNFGAVHASKCGLQFVTGDCFMVLAADMQDPPELIVQMAEKWRAGSKFIICSRISREDPLISKIYSALFYWLIHLLVMSDYPAGGYDMALMDKSILPHILNSSKNLYTPILAYWLGYKPDVIHYHRAKREHGKSTWTFKKKFQTFLDIMLSFSVTPIRLITSFGAIITTFSFTYGISVIINAFLGRIPVPGFATLVALIAFLLGLVIIMLGIICEYLWRIFEEVNKRPEVVIEEVY